MQEEVFWDLMSDGNRRRILALLHRSDQTPKDLLPFVNISSSGLSKHLRRLKDSGLVKETKHGRSVIYSLDRKQIQGRDEYFEKVLDHSMKGLQEYFKNKRKTSK